MIAEPGLLSSSPWSSDLLFKDIIQPDCLKSYLNLNDLDTGFSVYDGVDMNKTSREIKPGFGSSCSPSSASSDCSEDMSLDFIYPTNDSSVHLPDHDYLNTSFSLLDDHNLTVCSEEFDWIIGDNFITSDAVVDDEDSSSEALTRTTNSTPSKSKSSRLYDPLTDNKLWSKMTIEEQLEAVEGLTHIISTQMGLREQLDIIRVIEPTATVSPTDTEFVIDLSVLDDLKLSCVREYVRKAKANEIKMSKDALNKSTSASGNASGYSSSGSSSSCSGNASKNNNKDVHSKGKNSKKETKERRPAAKVYRPRQKKEYRQLMKERRSGLFVREEVLSLSTTTVLEEDVDIDIDILG